MWTNQNSLVFSRFEKTELNLCSCGSSRCVKGVISELGETLIIGVI